jgi:hypothetical protein
MKGGNSMNIIGNELVKRYEQVYFDEFYKDIFDDELSHKELDDEGSFTPGEYIGIATRISTFKAQNGKETTKSHNYYIYDGLDTLDELVHEDKSNLANEIRRLTIVSPVSYCGSRRTSQNSRFLYSLVVEIDHLVVNKKGEQTGLEELLYQIDKEKQPRPTYIVASGSGVHLYYKFEKPIPCFANVKKSLWRYKKQLTKKLWNKFVTFDYQPEKIQYESVFQGFRMVGTRTKQGDLCEAFRTGPSVTIEYMNQFSAKTNQIDIVYKSELPLAKAKELYPEWYDKRIVKGDKSKGHWDCNRALYDWWKDRISNETVVGHRYYCLMCLSVYAIKCNIDFEELEKDAYGFLEQFEDMTTNEDNHFHEEDVEAALDIYRNRGDNLYTYPITYIERHSGLAIERNKRNGRTQSEHVRMMNFVRDELNHNDTWNKIGNGRKAKYEIVYQWRQDHPNGKKVDCIRETGLTKPTVYKWWDIQLLDLRKEPKEQDPRLAFLDEIE